MIDSNKHHDLLLDKVLSEVLVPNTDDTADFGAPTSLTIFEVAQLDLAFTSILDKVENFVINLSQIQEVDGAGVQWLSHLVWTVERCEKQIRLLKPNTKIIEAGRLMGMGPIILRNQNE